MANNLFSILYFYSLQDWENESTPLEPKGKGPPKFIGPVDKHSCNEGTQILFQRIYTK